MIISRGPRPHICLRCQLALANRRPSSMAQVANKSNLSPEQPDTDHKLPLHSQLLDSEENIPKSPHTTASITLQNKTIFTGLGSTKVGSIERLNVDKDKPSRIIVLRDSFLSRYRKKPREVPPADAVPIDILDQLGNEVGLVKASEVRENIEGLRPKNNQLETWESFNQLVDELSDGFTTAQLEQYIDHFNEKNPPKSPQEPITRSSESPISLITPWRPGISSIQNYFDNDSDRGYLLESRTSKQRTAIRLLRDCWEVELSELSEGIGQFELQIRPDVLELLLSGTPSYLQDFHDEVLTREEESLEVFRSRNVLRISSTDARKYWIVQEFEKLMQRLRIYKVLLGDLMPTLDVRKRSTEMLDAWTNKTFDNRTLAEVKRLTGVVITKDGHGKITLASFVKESGAQQSSVDTARRLLLTARPVSNLTRHFLASADVPEVKPISYSQLDGLNWWSRIRPWFRWTTPICKKEDLPLKGLLPQPSPIKSLNSHNEDPEKESVSDTSSELTPPSEANPEVVWSPSYSTMTSATLGAIIHNYSGDESNLTLSSEFIPKDTIKEFSTHVPNITRLLSSAQYERRRGSGDEVVLRFLPNPFFKLKQKSGKRKSITAAVLSAFPPVEIIFRASRQKTMKYSHTRAIVRDSRVDISLPQEVVDLRIRQLTYSLLLNKKLKSIKSFISSCELNLQPGGNISVPSSITLPISSYLCNHQGIDLFKGVRKTSSPKKRPDLLTQTVEYLFAGLEIRKKLTFKYDSWNLDYTYVDAGRSGGKRGELSLRPIKDKMGTTEQEFIDFSLELACRLTALSTPEFTRFREITKIPSSPVRKYVPYHQPSSTYPRSFLYIPRRIPLTNGPDTDESKELLPDFEEEATEFEDELEELEANSMLQDHLVHSINEK